MAIEDPIGAEIKNLGESFTFCEKNIEFSDSPYAALYWDAIFADALNGAVIIELPPVVDDTSLIIKKEDATANTVTINASGGETIDDGGSAVLTLQYESITIIGDGTNWKIY